jgi:hypothetical protein
MFSRATAIVDLGLAKALDPLFIRIPDRTPLTPPREGMLVDLCKAGLAAVPQISL